MPAEKRFPGGTIGVVLSASEENYQEDLFFPADGRLVAVNVAGDPEMGTLVYDLNSANEYDAERYARLQSAFRVLKHPLGVANALGFQLGASGQSDTGGGWFVDNVPGDPERIVIGQGSAGSGGPLDCGDGKCKHFYGKDEDGNPIGSLHITTRALFRKNNSEDGPIRFEDVYEEGEDGQFVYPVHLGWTGFDWALWMKGPIGETPDPPKIPTSEFIPRRTTTVVPSGGTVDIPTSVFDPGGGSDRIQIFSPSTSIPPDIETSQVRPTPAAPVRLSTLSVIAEMTSPGIAAQAQTSVRGKKNLKNSTKPPTASTFAQWITTPIVAIMSAFGAQGGEHPTYGGAGTGASGDPWVYTQRPGHSKYSMGTASGGFVFLPPEVSMGDHATGFAPAGVTQSTAYVLAGPGAWWGAGIPETRNGSLQDGYSWGMDTATGDLVWRRHTDGETPVTAFKFDHSDGDFYWRSVTDYWGQLAHANTADRVYTFPDASGTIPLGTGTANQVAYWSATNTLAGDPGMTYDAAANALTLTGYLRIGTSNRAIGNGDWSAGSNAGPDSFWDGTNGILTLYNAANAETWIMSGLAGQHNYINAASADIDTIINGDTAEVLRVDASTDRVGVGVSAPATRLEVLHSTAAQLRLTKTAATAFMDFHFGPSLASGDTLALNWNGSTPEATVSNYTVTLFNAGTASIGIRDVTNNVEGLYYAYSGGVLLGAATNHSLFLRTNNTDRITVLGTGATTIAQWQNTGTTTDASAQGDAAFGLTAAGRWFWDQSTQIQHIYSSATANTPAVHFHRDSDEALVAFTQFEDSTAANANTFRIGTGASGYELRLYGGAVIEAVRISGTALVINNGLLNFDTQIGGDTDANLFFTDASTDRVGVGTATPDVKFDVLSTSTQMRHTYTDGSVYSDWATGSDGKVTLTTVGSLGGFVFGGNYRFAHGTSALATTATEGFMHVQSCAGAPTGVPASIPTGQIPMVYDSTNHRIYFYSGSWRSVAVA